MTICLRKVLSEQFGLSNKTVEVLDVLVDEQLIEKRPRSWQHDCNLNGQKMITLKLGHHGSTLHEAELRDLLAVFHKEYPYIQSPGCYTLPSNSPECLEVLY